MFIDVTQMNKHLIFRCAKNNNIKIIRYYLNNGYDIKTKIASDNFLLHCVRQKCINIVKLLFNKKKDVIDNRFNVNDLLIIGTKSQCFTMIKLVLDYCNVDVNYNNNYALNVSIRYGNVDIVRLLLKYCVDIHIHDDLALRLSAKLNHIMIVKLLLNAGADVNANNGEALMWSIKNNNKEMKKMLLDTGANIVHNESKKKLGIIQAW